MESRFAYDTTGKYVNNKAFIIDFDEKYLVGVLGSKIVWQYLNSVCTSVQGNALELKSIYMLNIPIPGARQEQKKEIEHLVDICINGRETEAKEANDKINFIVKGLYGL